MLLDERLLHTFSILYDILLVTQVFNPITRVYLL